jgi:hypothetical protein
LSKREGKIGTPERPLSDLGLLSYKSYWNRVLLEALSGKSGEVSVSELSKKTNIRVEDILIALQSHSSVRFFKDQGYLNISDKGIRALQKSQRDGEDDLKIIPERLKWNPHDSSMQVSDKRRQTRFAAATNTA